MTDYITDLRDALHDAAAREYSAARAPRSSRARTHGFRRLLALTRPTALAGISLLAAVTAAMVALVIGATTTTQPAYALVQHPDGSVTVTVTVHNLRTAESPLNARLAALGINERIIPISGTCPRANWAFVYTVKRSQFPQLRWTFTPRESRRYPKTGEWGYIGIGFSGSGQLLLAQGAMKPPLPSCFNSALGQLARTPTP